MLFAKDGNLTHLTLGPKLIFVKSNRFIPYFKAGAVFRQPDWSNPAGNFENGKGWHAGIGIDFLGVSFKIGLNFTFQDIKNDYLAPGKKQAESNQDSMDFSGYNISGFFKHYF